MVGEIEAPGAPEGKKGCFPGPYVYSSSPLDSVGSPDGYSLWPKIACRCPDRHIILQRDNRLESEMENSDRNIHYLLLQEDYYTSRNIRRMIDNIRPDYIFSGSSERALGDHAGVCLCGIDLVIADLQLAEGIFFNLMPPDSCRKPVIIMAENESFLNEMKGYNLVDYVLKPVSCKDMENSLNKFEEYYQPKS